MWPMNLPSPPYRQIRAVYDEHTIRVYQADSDEIADAALGKGTFVSPPFKMERMTWIKPSFLWMMYRSGWGAKRCRPKAHPRHRYNEGRLRMDAVSQLLEPAGTAPRGQRGSTEGAAGLRTGENPVGSGKGSAAASARVACDSDRAQQAGGRTVCRAVDSPDYRSFKIRPANPRCGPRE
jgi:hypothetical protein